MKVELEWDERYRIAEWARNEIEAIESGDRHYVNNDEVAEIAEQILAKMSDD